MRGTEIATKHLFIALLLVAAACSSGQESGQGTAPTPEPVVVQTTSATVVTSESTPTTITNAGPQGTLPFELIEGEIVQLVPEVVASFPHPIDVFTQGLEVRKGVFYESAGRYRESRVRIFESDGTELATADNSPDIFGEGLTLVGDRLIQISWREQTAFAWDIETLQIVDRYAYEGEGWGICLDDDRLIMSDGTPTLTFRDPATFEGSGTVEVTLDGRPLDAINELECVGGYVMANIWPSDLLVIIDPGTGEVVALVDATSLRDELAGSREFGALNGIAYDIDDGALYLTGKNWPTIFEVRLSSG